LGVLKNHKVKVVPKLPDPYEHAIRDIGIAYENRLLVSFRTPFWHIESGWLSFVTRGQKDRYPLAFICPSSKQKHLLMVVVAGKNSLEIGECSDAHVWQDFRQHLSQFIEPSLIDIEEVKITKWHRDAHSFGSYSICKLVSREEHFSQLRVPLEDKVWLAGEHTHPIAGQRATVHGAFETGVMAAQEAVGTSRDPKAV
jgi:monoamine oxidase